MQLFQVFQKFPNEPHTRTGDLQRRLTAINRAKRLSPSLLAEVRTLRGELVAYRSPQGVWVTVVQPGHAPGGLLRPAPAPAPGPLTLGSLARPRVRAGGPSYGQQEAAAFEAAQRTALRLEHYARS